MPRIREEENAKKPRTAVAGFDLTFSPSKSVSAIWGVADAGTQALIAQAHHAAMRDTIAMLEDRVAVTHVGAGGIAQMPIEGVIATTCDHYDSRAADPQLHTHVVVSNKVQHEPQNINLPSHTTNYTDQRWHESGPTSRIRLGNVALERRTIRLEVLAYRFKAKRVE